MTKKRITPRAAIGKKYSYCTNCKEYRHKFANCPGVECRKCRGLGHIEINCPFKNIKANCNCKGRKGSNGTKVNQTCPIHQKECLCFNRAAEYCEKHNHEIMRDKYQVCEECAQNPRQQKKDRQIVRDFSYGCPVCIREGYHEHMYCRVHRRYPGTGEEKCYKCQKEYKERSLE